MMHQAKTFALAAAVLAATAFSAGATTFNVIDSSSQTSNDAGVGYAVGYGNYTPAGAAWSTNPTVNAPPDSEDSVYQSPFNNVGGAVENTDYFSVGAVKDGNGASSPVTLTFAGDGVLSFDILWGSLDHYNTISFSGGNGSYTGTDIATTAIALGGLGLAATTNYEYVALVHFVFDSAVKTITFSSGQAAFEFALASPVPVPAGGLLLLGALGGLAALRRRRNAA